MPLISLFLRVNRLTWINPVSSIAWIDLTTAYRLSVIWGTRMD
jgi:hypothetical protein